MTIHNKYWRVVTGESNKEVSIYLARESTLLYCIASRALVFLTQRLKAMEEEAT